MYPWRMEHFTNIQKFYIRTKDVIIGLTRDLQYIQDVSCPKLYALIDRDSLNYQNIQITLTGNTIAASLEFNSPDGKHVTTLSENFDLDLPINLNSEEIPENTKALYGNYAWKSEMIILTPLIIQFFTPIIQDLFAFPVSQDKITPRAEVQNNRDSFMNALRRLIDGHICPSREKVAELVGYYFDSPLSESFQTLFIDVIYTIMHSPDGSPKENFRDDVVRIVEILNQYEQSL